MSIGRISLSVFLTVSSLIKLFIFNLIIYLYGLFSSTHRQVSRNGGSFPLWNRNSNMLFIGIRTRMQLWRQLYSFSKKAIP